MKNIIFASIALIFLFLWPLPQETAAAETDPAKLVALLNSKTAKIKHQWQREYKDKGITKKYQEVNSYVFSLDQKQLKVEFKEVIKTFTNGQHSETYTVIGKNTAEDSGKIDPGKIGIVGNRIMLGCRGKEPCMVRDEKSIVYKVKGEKTTENASKLPARTLAIHGSDLNLAQQIIKDSKALFSVLAPLPKPAEKTGPEAVVGKK